MRRLAIIAGVLLAGVAILPSLPTATATTTSLAASADAFVSSATPQTNHGASEWLYATAGTVDRRSYVRFALGAAGTTLSRATLTLYSRVASPGVQVRRVLGNWAEASVTYRTAPAVGPVAAASGPLAAGASVQLDVSSLLTSADHLDVAITANQLNSRFDSRERGATGPRLTIDRTAATTTTAAATTTTAAATTTTATGGGAGLCGANPGVGIRHVVWVFMENHSFADIVGSGEAPFINGTILPGCGLATNFTAETHPSLPNYLAATSGSTLGVTTDCQPASCPQSATSIFEQVQAAGLSWRAYNESMPANCSKTDSGRYAARHNPAVYYTNIAAACQQFDVPSTGFAADVNAGRLPSFTFFTPNLCNDMHDCSISTGDTFLKGLVNTLVAGPNYRSGDTAVFITWDEGEGGSQNIVTMVLSGSTPPGTRSATAFNHYSMLATAEDLLGLGRLRNAAGASSMAAAFGLR